MTSHHHIYLSVSKQFIMNKLFLITLILLSLLFVLAPQAFAQKLLDPTASSGPLSSITASSGGANTSVALAYSVRQLKTTYDHAAITPPSGVSGFTNSS